MSDLTRHFTLAEATRSDTARRLGIPNTPSPEAFERIMNTAFQMERVRSVLKDNPITITSWFRNPQVNSAVGGVAESAHLRGDAVDFVCPGYGSVTEVCRAIRDSDIEFDQLIWEHDRWVHLSFDPRMRRQVLRTRVGGGYHVGLPK